MVRIFNFFIILSKVKTILCIKKIKNYFYFELLLKSLSLYTYINLRVIFVMPKILKRFFKKLPLKIKTLKYSIREYLSTK